MKKAISLLLVLCVSSFAFAQYDYEPSKEYPFGRYNPVAPEQLKDFEALIGECTCSSVSRNQDQFWKEPEKIIWRWKYIMNGNAVQDETLKPDGSHSGSIRQFHKDSMRWNVHYYSSQGITVNLPTWHGNKKDDKIILYRPQKAPNGMEGFYRITFYEMSKKGYKWLGEWVDTTEKIVYPTWKIDCKRED